MIGAIMLIVLLSISILTLFVTLIYGIIFFYKEKEYPIVIMFLVGFLIIIFTCVGGLLAQMGI